MKEKTIEIKLTSSIDLKIVSLILSCEESMTLEDIKQAFTDYIKDINENLH